MKRTTFTSIIGKVQVLMFDAISSGRSQDNYTRIRKAARNELQRLTKDTYKRGFSEGYNAGFECAEIASRSIFTASKRFDEIEAGDIQSDTPKDLAIKSDAGLSPLMEQICGSLKPRQ